MTHRVYGSGDGVLVPLRFVWLRSFSSGWEEGSVGSSEMVVSSRSAVSRSPFVGS